MGLLSIFRSKEKPSGVEEVETAVPESKIGSEEEKQAEEASIALEQQEKEDIFGRKSYEMPAERFWKQIKLGEFQDKYGRTISRRDMKQITKEMVEKYGKEMGPSIGKRETNRLIHRLDTERRTAKIQNKTILLC